MTPACDQDDLVLFDDLEAKKKLVHLTESFFDCLFKKWVKSVANTGHLSEYF
jgi:hypothetical protein